MTSKIPLREVRCGVIISSPAWVQRKTGQVLTHVLAQGAGWLLSTSLPNFTFSDFTLAAWDQARWEYLHHRNWQTLQIRAFFPPREPAVKHLPAHHCCQHSSCLSLGMTGFLLIHKFWFKYHLFRETFLSELTPTPVTSYCIIASFFRALISICNYPVCVFYGLVYCATSSREILPCLVYCCIPSIKRGPGTDQAFNQTFSFCLRTNGWVGSPRSLSCLGCHRQAASPLI